MVHIFFYFTILHAFVNNVLSFFGFLLYYYKNVATLIDAKTAAYFTIAVSILFRLSSIGLLW